MASLRSYAQDFLNSLKELEAERLLKTMQLCDNCSDLVNLRRFDKSLDIEQFKTMKSSQTKDDGWMLCKVNKHNVKYPPRSRPSVKFRLNGGRWCKAIQKHFNEFAVSNSISTLTITCHHIVLRYKLGKEHSLVLERGRDVLQASHLCNTKGCVSSEVNSSRNCCGGILVRSVYENTAGQFTISQIDACRHGIQHEEANGDFLKYSCRKIRAVFQKKRRL